MLTGGRNVGDSLQRWPDGEREKGFGCVVKMDGIAVLKGLELKRKKKKEKKEKEKGKREDEERKRKKIEKDKRGQQGKNGERGCRRTSLESTIV